VVTLPELLQAAERALASREAAALQWARDALLTWHAGHHGGRNAPLDTWEETRAASIQGVYCTGCQVWPVIVKLHHVYREANQ
jgi:hypothetical protein